MVRLALLHSLFVLSDVCAGWSTDGMSQAQALAEARRGVLIEDQAAYRAAAAQHRRAVLDGAEAGSFVSAAAPASLPRQDALQFSTFAK